MTELTAQQTAQLDQALTGRYQSLMAEVQEEMERTGNIQYAEVMRRAPGDIGDESMADAVADFNLAIVDRQIHEMRDIEAAKRRIKAGDYGVCIDCGTDIGFNITHSRACCETISQQPRHDLGWGDIARFGRRDESAANSPSRTRSTAIRRIVSSERRSNVLPSLFMQDAIVMVEQSSIFVAIFID